MTNNMETIIYLVALGLMAVGMALAYTALSYRTEKAPQSFTEFFYPRYWMPVWKTRPFFTARGFKLYMTGTTMGVLGALIALVNMLVSP